MALEFTNFQIILWTNVVLVQLAVKIRQFSVSPFVYGKIYSRKNRFLLPNHKMDIVWYCTCQLLIVFSFPKYQTVFFFFFFKVRRYATKVATDIQLKCLKNCRISHRSQRTFCKYSFCLLFKHFTHPRFSPVYIQIYPFLR